MCGIVGVINYGKHYQLKINEMFTQMLLLDVIRGKDSTGMFKAKEENTDWRKAPVPAWEFFDLKGVKEFLAGLGDWPFLVGHNRWATRGKVTAENAHPFEEGKITLVHNGTLSSMYQLPDHEKFDVDSNLLAHAINKIGIHETIAKAGGAMALVYYNTATSCLHLYRNDERPLFLLDLPQESMYLFGSEIELLVWVASRNGYKPGERKLLESNLLYSFRRFERNPSTEKLTPYAPSYKKIMHEMWDEYAEYGELRENPQSNKIMDIFRNRRAQRTSTAISPIIMNKFSLGQKLFFSVNDYNERIFQGNFVSFEGDVPSPDGRGTMPSYIVRGNFRADEADKLATTKNLLQGIITSIQGIRQGQVLLQVKEVIISDKLDPFFLSDEEKLLWSNEHKQTKTCTGCYTENDELFLVYKTGGPKNLCKKCLHEYDPKNRLNAKQIN